MNNHQTFSVIKSPFYVDEINSMPLEGEVESSFCDFQEALKLTDAQADARDAETELTNFECRNSKGQRVVFTIAQNALISCDEKGDLSTSDIFGNPLIFTITQAHKTFTLNDVLAYHADPKNCIPAHQVVLNWMDVYRNSINQFINVSFCITDEYRASFDHDYLLFRGDLRLDFKINKQKFDIVMPCFLALKELDGVLVLDRDPIDVSRDDWECFQSILIDVDELKHDKLKVLAEKIDIEFTKYFNLNKVPMWQERILESFKHEDILDILKAMKHEKTSV